MTNKEYVASLLIEAAELLDELGIGRHSFREVERFDDTEVEKLKNNNKNQKKATISEKEADEILERRLNSKNECVAKLLIDAAELLDESAGRNGQAMRYREEFLKNNKDNLSKDSVDTIKNNNEVYKRQKKWHENEIKKHKDYKKLFDDNDNKTGSKSCDYTIDKLRRDSRNIGRTGSRTGHYQDEELFGRYMNKRKSQNECVAELLIEAAELLSETSFDEVNKARNKFLSNHENRMKELNDTLNKIKNNVDDEKIKSTQKENFDEISKLLDSFKK